MNPLQPHHSSSSNVDKKELAKSAIHVPPSKKEEVGKKLFASLKSQPATHPHEKIENTLSKRDLQQLSPKGGLKNAPSKRRLNNIANSKVCISRMLLTFYRGVNDGSASTESLFPFKCR